MAWRCARGHSQENAAHAQKKRTCTALKGFSVPFLNCIIPPGVRRVRKTPRPSLRACCEKIRISSWRGHDAEKNEYMRRANTPVNYEIASRRDEKSPRVGDFSLLALEIFHRPTWNVDRPTKNRILKRKKNAAELRIEIVRRQIKSVENYLRILDYQA